jgi:hypothetical protein
VGAFPLIKFLAGFHHQITNEEIKNSVSKNQGWEPIHQKYKANENTSRHNPKKNKDKQITKIR